MFLFCFIKILNLAFYIIHKFDFEVSLHYWLLWPMVRRWVNKWFVKWRHLQEAAGSRYGSKEVGVLPDTWSIAAPSIGVYFFDCYFCFGYVCTLFQLLCMRKTNEAIYKTRQIDTIQSNVCTIFFYCQISKISTRDLHITQSYVIKSPP